MSVPDLRHLAVIAAAPESTEAPARAVSASCADAARIAREAFALVPGLQAFSWLAPGLDRILARHPAAEAAAACGTGTRALAAAAADLGLSLRLCGKVDDLPDVTAGLPPVAQPGRTLLWFQRYGGRDEIVRAANRFFGKHPGEILPDTGLDAFLDTAGLPDPDLLLYVGGTLEPHDVLTWQGSYAEIWHTPTPVQSFGPEEFRSALSGYAERQRRFGR